jgi:phosphate:Na+ symporter
MAMDLSINHYALWTGLFGGLALFLFGMDLMTGALKRAAGDYLKEILGRLTRNRFMGVGVGALITGIVNSSSVTTVILVGFISAGLLSMAQSISVIMGANIGSTITAQILAFNVTEFSLPLIAFGVLIVALANRNVWRDYGHMLLGFGLVFYGMGLMSNSMAPLRSYPSFTDFIASLSNPYAAILAGTAFTAVIQSSAATTGIIIMLAGQGIMSLETAIAVALGANIGTCATAGLTVIGKPREAVRAALVHVLFNVAGVLVWITFIPQLAELARLVSPTAEGLSAATRSAAEAPRQIANAHTIFNIANTLLFIGFTTQFARLVEWIVPDRPLSNVELLPPRFLDVSLLSTPAIALGNARLEIGRLGEYVHDMLQKALPAAVSQSSRDLDALEELDKPADDLHREILAYLGKISLTSLSAIEGRTLMRLAEVANDLEHVADRIATDIVTSARKRIVARVQLPPTALKPVMRLHGEVAAALRESVKAVVDNDDVLAAKVRAMKRGVGLIAQQIESESVKRLSADPKAGLTSYVREVELIEILDGIFKLARRIARSQLKNVETSEGTTTE